MILQTWVIRHTLLFRAHTLPDAGLLLGCKNVRWEYGVEQLASYLRKNHSSLGTWPAISLCYGIATTCLSCRLVSLASTRSSYFFFFVHVAVIIFLWCSRWRLQHWARRLSCSKCQPLVNCSNASQFCWLLLMQASTLTAVMMSYNNRCGRSLTLVM